MNEHSHYDLATGEGLMACPRCDALYRSVSISGGERLNCTRCGMVLANAHAGAFTYVVALSMTTIVLMFGAVFFPFLEISRMGFGNATSLFGVAMAFSEGWLTPLTLAMMGMIVGLPVLRALLLIYTLMPMMKGGPPRAHAAIAFRLSEEMRPWSMAEIFVIGTSVALVKIGGLARISLGPAFWAFVALILLTALSNLLMNSTVVWDAIEKGGLGTEDPENTAESPDSAKPVGAHS